VTTMQHFYYFKICFFLHTSICRVQYTAHNSVHSKLVCYYRERQCSCAQHTLFCCQ